MWMATMQHGIVVLKSGDGAAPSGYGVEAQTGEGCWRLVGIHGRQHETEVHGRRRRVVHCTVPAGFTSLPWDAARARAFAVAPAFPGASRSDTRAGALPGRNEDCEGTNPTHHPEPLGAPRWRIESVGSPPAHHRIGIAKRPAVLSRAALPLAHAASAARLVSYRHPPQPAYLTPRLPSITPPGPAAPPASPRPARPVATAFLAAEGTSATARVLADTSRGEWPW